MTHRSKQTPKPSRALIAAQQRRDRPMMRRVVAPHPADVAMMRAVREDSGPRCSCTHEHGDSDCAKHPTCFRCHMIIGYSDGEACSCAVPERDELAAFRALDVPAAPAAVEPRTFAVGQRVLLRRHDMGERCFVGQSGVIDVDDDSDTVRVTGLQRAGESGPCAQWVYRGDLEPAPASAPVDAWTPEACGWTRRAMDRDSWDGYERPGAMVNSQVHGNGYAHASRAGFADGYAPTLAQACCAALGIELRDNADQMDRDPWEAYLDGSPLECGPDAETCARAALAAHDKRGAR